MNEKIIKPGVVKRIVDSLKYKNKKYTQEDVENIVFSFWDVIIDALSNGDSVNLNGYATIGIKHMAERKSRNVAENKEKRIKKRLFQNIIEFTLKQDQS